MSIIKLDKPLVIKGHNAYPLTSADQVVKADGSRLETENGVNADTLGGKDVSYFANTEDINNSISEFSSEFAEKVPFKFGIDADGNYGYIKEGADTVTPFKVGYDIENYKITTISTAVTCNDCIIGKTYMILYAPWSSYGVSTAQGYLSITSCSGCETPTLLYSTNDAHHSVVGMYKTKATSNTFTVQFNTAGGGYIYVFE